MRMDEPESRRNEFVGYEYKTVSAESETASFLLDGYENFGWELDELLGRGIDGQGRVVLRLKRNRKLINKTELTRLQRNFEACVREIDALEASKKTAALIAALITGIVGTAFMAGATFCITGQTPHIIGCVLFAIPGFTGWFAPYFLHRWVVRRKTEKLTPLIEEKYDEIYEICEKGNKLLN